MKSYLDMYDITLTTIGPVFVGNGKNISKKEYYYRQGGKKVLILDDQKWYAYLKKKWKMQEYERYLLSKSQKSLYNWCKEQGIFPTEVKSCSLYSLECGDYIEESEQTLQIREFIKDGQGMPYIPGSSLKGMLRTILLGADILNRNLEYEEERQEIEEERQEIKSAHEMGKKLQSLSKKEEKLEIHCFHTLERKDVKKEKETNDRLAGLHISDSMPLSFSDLILCQKLEVDRDGNISSLNLLRESIRPKTDIHFTMTVDKNLCSYEENDVLQAIETFAKMYYQVFLQKFKRKEPSSDTVWLGGGSGFVAKTVLYPLLGESEGIETAAFIFDQALPEAVRNQHKHYLDKVKNVSPHILKCTKYQNKEYQMGMCSFQIQKANGRADI